MYADAAALLAPHAARIASLDAEQIEVPTRRSLLAWLERLDPRDAPVAHDLLTVAFDADESDTSTMLSLIDKRLRHHVSALGTICTLYLELLVTNAISDLEARPLLDSLPSQDEELRRRTLSALPVPNRGLRNAHRAFKAAWEASPREALYREPVHRGEHMPVLKPVTIVELALFIAVRITPLVDEQEPDFEKTLAFARSALAPPAKWNGPRLQLRGWNGLGPVQVIRQACQECAEEYLSKPESSENAWIVSRAASAATELIAGSGSSPATDVRQFLVELDEELRRLDVVTAVGKKRIASPIARAIYRARNIWLARLTNGGYGLLLKDGRRSKWLDGDRDEVLGSIPDEHFEKAVHAAKDSTEPAGCAAHRVE